eukprot:209505-Rhodomonas_salina.3
MQCPFLTFQQHLRCERSAADRGHACHRLARFHGDGAEAKILRDSVQCMVRANALAMRCPGLRSLATSCPRLTVEGRGSRSTPWTSMCRTRFRQPRTSWKR